MKRFLAPIRRRWWVVVLCIVVASATAYGAAKLRAQSYSAEAVLVVPASGPGPGHADEAKGLATTYAALIPQDQQLLRYVGARFGLTAKQAGRHITATTDTTTALLVVHYRANRQEIARRGAIVIARAVTGPHPATPNIAANSLSVVHLPTHASTSRGPRSIIALGAILGIFVGIVLLIALERSDPRIDDKYVLAAHAGCPATCVSELSEATTAGLLARWRTLSHAEPPTIALIATSSRSERALPALAEFMDCAAGADRINLVVGRVSDVYSKVATSRAAALAVVVSDHGGAVADLTTMLEEFAAFDGAPVWALLLDSEPPAWSDAVARETVASAPGRATAAAPPRC